MQVKKQLKPLTPAAQKHVSGGNDILQPGETWDEAHCRLGGSCDQPKTKTP